MSCRNAGNNVDLEDIFSRCDSLVPKNEIEKFMEMVKFLDSRQVKTDDDFRLAMIDLKRKWKCSPRKAQLLHVYNLLIAEGSLQPSKLKDFLITKVVKSNSGVLVITVMTSPHPKIGDQIQMFSCQWNCYYCPNEPGHEGNNWTPQPRSYLHDEPSVLRANRNHFDPVLQFHDRASTLAMNGHPVDKIELLILGGTWCSYPHQYQEEFIRDLFYAANTFHQRTKRERASLQEEKKLNETAVCKIIGITLETRPDTIDLEEIKRFRNYGCTRIQLGIQHIDNYILKKINRGCTTEDAIRAIRLLKDNCFKIDIHLMPNLPYSNPELDKKMFDYVLHSSNLQADQWKIYPCEITPYTVIEKWYQSGKYVPYSEQELINVLLYTKRQVHPWIRLNRVIRDIPSQYILGGIDSPNLREVLVKKLKDEGTPCRCIRCREVRNDRNAINTAQIFDRVYLSSGGIEHFISFETPDEKTILAFLRLRFCENDNEETLPELRNAALIRELHVYGKLITTNSSTSPTNAQHVGLGRQLIQYAEKLSIKNGFRKIAVISGVGVRNYYKKFGYELVGEGEYLLKKISPDLPSIPSPFTKSSFTVNHNDTKLQQIIKIPFFLFLTCIFLFWWYSMWNTNKIKLDIV